MYGGKGDLRRKKSCFADRKIISGDNSETIFIHFFRVIGNPYNRKQGPKSG